MRVVTVFADLPAEVLCRTMKAPSENHDFLV